MSDSHMRFVQVHVFRRSEPEAEYLLLKRAVEEKVYPGLWQMVTGGIEAGEQAVETAVRETQEETGMQNFRIFLVPYVAVFYLAEDDSINHVPVFAAEATQTESIILSPEHQQFGWFKYAEAMKLLVFPGHKEGLSRLHEALTTEVEACFLTELSRSTTLRGTST